MNQDIWSPKTKTYAVIQKPRAISTPNFHGILTLSPLIEFSYCLSKVIFETNMMSRENIKMYQGQMFHSKDFGKAGPNGYSME